MSTDSYHKRKLGNRVLQPETQMMGYGYDPALSEGSLMSNTSLGLRYAHSVVEIADMPLEKTHAASPPSQSPSRS